MIQTFAAACGSFPAAGCVSVFRGSSGVAEYHLAISPVETGTMESQLDAVLGAYQVSLNALGVPAHTAVLRRFYCSDLSNQRSLLEAQPLSNPETTHDPCAVSWIGQPPAPPAKVALWACHCDDPAGPLDKTLRDKTLTVRRGGLKHHWTAGLTCPEKTTAYDQTLGVLDAYEARLAACGVTLAEHVVRTWLFVRDVDADYPQLVTARRERFAARGLTPDTHFIASTGVGGAHVDTATKVTLDGYAIGGLEPAQVTYLSAPEHLSPTHIYGVTFERATAIRYRDRKHIILSGTASIDAEGKIVHPGDVARQFDRTIENIEALMAAGGATLRDLCTLTVYIRDPSDHELAWRQIRARFGKVPAQVVVSSVCRPGWLIEIEGLAVVPADNPELPPY